MKRKDDWLDFKITEELMTMADEREKQLMEMEELKDIDMPIEKFAEIREAGRRRRKGRILHTRVLPVTAAALLLVMGLGIVSVGDREYTPETITEEDGGRTQTSLDNADSETRLSVESEVYGEIESALGIYAARLVYIPPGMELVDWWVDADLGEAVMCYSYQDNELKVYTSKTLHESTSKQVIDGEVVDVIEMQASGLQVQVYEYEDSDGTAYYAASFELFNTYYSVSGMIPLEEFEKIVENITIQNA